MSDKIKMQAALMNIKAAVSELEEMCCEEMEMEEKPMGRRKSLGNED